MAKKTKKADMNAQVQPIEFKALIAPTVTSKIIVAQYKYNRWYVYFQGVAPKDNVGCGCKTAKSAMRYMFLLRKRYGATISQNILDRLAFEAAREA